MKPLIISVLFILFYLPGYGQNLPDQKTLLSAGSVPNTTLQHSPHKRQNNKVAIGGMMIVTGGIAGYFGTKIIADQRPLVTNDTYVGEVVAALGCATIVTGIVFIIRGINQHHSRRYGFEIIAPKRNELGITYNF